MNLPCPAGISWTKLVLALLLICVIFSFAAMARTQHEAPLDADAVSALIDELKDGLANQIEDEDTVNAITEKWDAHEDLAGKTKSQILKILFADVKSVVADKQTQDSIWASWANQETSAAPAVEAPAPPPVKAPAPPAAQSTCRPNAGLLKSKQAEKFGFVRVGHRLWFATGTVRCFDEQKGFGYITADDGGPDLFVHFSSINMDGFKTLKEGQKVQYEICRPTKPNAPPAACNVQAAG